jgi:hypothetical protein
MRACAVTASSSPRSPTTGPNSAPSGTPPSRPRSA